MHGSGNALRADSREGTGQRTQRMPGRQTALISGRWGNPADVLLDLVAGPDGVVRGLVNPGRQVATIRHGRFDASSGAVHLEGAHVAPDGAAIPFRIDGHLRGRTLCLSYCFGDAAGTIDLMRVEAYAPRTARMFERLKARVARFKRALNARFRPGSGRNRRRLRDRGESVDTIVFRDAVAADIPALADLHVATWNATYRTNRGPGVGLRTRQWSEVLHRRPREDFVLVLENREGRLIGFTWGKPHGGEFAGELSKIYLRWEYHGLGLGRRMLAETAARFLERGMDSFVLFSESSNPTIGFFDHLGGERLLDEHGLFAGGFAWRDARPLAAQLARPSTGQP